MMKVYAQPGAGRKTSGGTTTTTPTTTLRQRYTANRQAGYGRVASAVNALRGRTA